MAIGYDQPFMAIASRVLIDGMHILMTPMRECRISVCRFCRWCVYGGQDTARGLDADQTSERRGNQTKAINNEALSMT